MNLANKKKLEELKKKEEEEEIAKRDLELKKQIDQKIEEKKRLKNMQKMVLKKRIAELAETREFLQKHREKFEEIQRDRTSDYSWGRYLLCDGLPNPILPKEINTYISLWRMNETRISMEDVMLDSVDALKLIDELQMLIADLDDEYEDRQRYKDTMQELRELVQEKLDRASVETLSKACHFADHETNNLQMTWRNDWLSMCMWGNLSKNPRIRSFSFSDVGITFDIPKPLTLSDCAFRVLFMKFDHYSVTSPSFVPKLFEIPVAKFIPIQPSTADSLTKINLNKGTERLSAHMDVNAIIDPFGEPGVGDTDENVTESEVIEIPEEDRLITPPPQEFDSWELPEDAIDLCDYHMIGGVFQFDLLTLPRQPRTGRGWTITTCVRPPRLTPFEYLVNQVEEKSEVDNEIKSEEVSTDEKEQQKPEENKDEHPPVQVRLRLPKCLVIPEEPLMACWDPATLNWRTTGIYIDSFKEDENELTFRASVFGTFAVFQEYHLNMPFQGWELRPLPMAVNKQEQLFDYTGSESGDSAHDDINGLQATVSAPVYRSRGQPPTEQRTPGLSTQGVGSAVPSVHSDAANVMDKVGETKWTDEDESAILGPLPSMGLPSSTYLSDLTEANQCLLTITGALIEVKLHILGERIAVITDRSEPVLGQFESTEAVSTVQNSTNLQAQIQPSDNKAAKSSQNELENLAGRWFTTDELINVLQISGVNLFPRDDSSTRIECLEKNPIIEQRLYEQMALLSPAVAFGWSRWNSDCQNQETLLVTAVEHLDNANPVDEENWRVYSMNRKKVEKLKMREYDGEFNAMPDPNIEFHADFYHMFMDFGSEQGRERVRQIDSRYFKTVRRVLKATRLLIYS